MWAYNVMFAGIALLVTALERERAAAAAALRAREAQYRAIVENGLLMFCRFRRDGVLTFVNDTCCRLLGEPREQLLGRNVRSTANDAWLLASVFGEATSIDSRVTTEHHTVAPDGTTRWTRWTYREVVNEATGDAEIEAVGRDVTTEHKTAADREALALRNWAIVAALGDVVYDWRAEDGRLEWDGDVAQVLGYPADGIGAHLDGWVAHVHPDDRAGMLAALERATRDNALYDHEYRFRRGDGSWVWIQDRAVTFAGEGRLKRMIGVLRDVTERKEAEQALRDSETRFRMAAELSSDLIYEWDIAANRIVGSGRVRDMFDAPPPIESTMEGWTELVHPDDRARVRAAIDAHLTHGMPFQQQYRVLHPDGVRTWTDRATTIRDTEGHPIRWYGVRTDVTTQVGLEQQLRQSQKMESVGLLAGGVAHDFNNLLQVIQGFTALAQDDALPEPERQGSLRQVSQAADRAAALTRQLLAFGRRQPLRIADADLADLVAQLLKMVRRLIGEHIEVDFTAAAGSLAVRCDRSQIEQVLMNLCLNARDAMPRGGRLTIAVDEWRAHRRDTLLRPGLRDGHYARLRVTDVGCGMDETTRRRAFEPFFTTKPEGHGTGLGLAVAYGVVKQHDGYIDVESTPGGGSTFTVLLPLQAPAVTPEVGVSPVRAGMSGHEVILLAEDEAAVRSLGEHVLRRAGYRVLTARDGADAIRVFNAHEDEIALAVLDAVMPRLSGQDVARAIVDRRPTIPVLLCSGYPGSPSDIALSGAAAFLAKPWRPAQLLGQVRQLLDGVEGHSPPESPYP
jgi:two-component system, cell cycle sensor histidine kinase and response regulator CckA